MSSVTHAIEKTLLEPHAIELTTNEHKSALAGLRRWPGSPRLRIQQHMHAVKIKLPRLARKIQNPFHPHEVLALLLHELVDPPIKAIRVKRIVGLHGAGGNRIVVFMVMLVLQNTGFDRQHMGQRKPGHTEQGIGRYFGVRGANEAREGMSGRKTP